MFIFIECNPRSVIPQKLAKTLYTTSIYIVYNHGYLLVQTETCKNPTSGIINTERNPISSVKRQSKSILRYAYTIQ